MRILKYIFNHEIWRRCICGAFYDLRMESYCKNCKREL